MKTALLSLLLISCLGAGVHAEGCDVSEWSEWSEWASSHHDGSVKSYPGTDQPGVERYTILDMMEIKMDEKEMIRECRQDGSCPEYNPRASQGRVDCVNGFADGLECWNINQLSFVNISDMFYDPSLSDDPWANDNWGWTSPTTGDEYVLQGLSVGTTFVRITDPVNPEIVGHLKTHGDGNAPWRDVKVIGNYAYIVSEEIDHGIQVFDLTRLDGVAGPVVFTEDAHYADIGGCHNVISNEETGYIYAVGCITGNYTKCGGGLHVVDVTDPLNPEFAGCFEEDGYTHDAQCIIYRGPDANYYGREMCFCYNEDDLTIVDVNDKNNMTMVSKTSYTGYMYTHQGWLTEDQSILLLDDEMDEGGVRATDNHTKTYVWDVVDLANPVLMNTYVAAVESVDHNQYTLGDLTFQANYMTGLRILSIDQANYQLTEVAYFDTYPGVNTANFHGCWSVYPYFASGNLAVSDAEYGLFIVRPDYPVMKQAIHERSTYAERKRYRDILESDDVTACARLVDTERMKI